MPVHDSTKHGNCHFHFVVWILELLRCVVIHIPPAPLFLLRRSPTTYLYHQRCLLQRQGLVVQHSSQVP